MYQPKFTITNEILKNIGIIEACKSVIDSAALIPAYERRFREDAALRMVHHGTHIEGNELNLSQAQKVLAGGTVDARQRDIQEVINYRKVVEFIGGFRVKGEGERVDESLIKQIHKFTVHKILPEERSGIYRTTQVVVKSNQTEEVTFRPPTAGEVLKQMEDFIAWLNNTESNDVHPILSAGVVHYELVRIHPFVDGNGRVARALSMLVLFQNDYDIRRFFSLEEYFDSDPENYYNALQSVDPPSQSSGEARGDLSFWLEYFTKGLAIELTKIKEKIQRLSVDVHLKEKLGGQVFLTDRQIKIMEYIQSIGLLQNRSFGDLFPMVSEDTILRELKDLVKKKIIKKVGKTKAARYVMR